MIKSLLIAAILMVLVANVASQEWQTVKSPTVENITGIYMVTADTGYIVTSEGSAFKTTDKCQSWVALNVPGYSGLESLTFLNTKSGWVCGRRGAILHTRNGGETWATQSWEDPKAIFFDIEMLDKDTGIAVGMRPTSENKRASIAVKTVDGGKSWDLLEPMGMAYSEIRYIKPNHKLLFMALGKLNISDDGIRNWNSYSTIEGPPARTFDILGTTGILGGLGGNLGYSNDSGKTWFKLEAQNSENHLISSVLLNPNEGYMGGSNGYMIATSNGGRIWNQEPLPTTFLVLDMFATNDRVYAVGSGGTILYKQILQISK